MSYNPLSIFSSQVLGNQVLRRELETILIPKQSAYTYKFLRLIVWSCGCGRTDKIIKLNQPDGEKIITEMILSFQTGLGK